MMTKAKPMVFQLSLLTVVLLLNYSFAAGRESLVVPDLPDMTVPSGSTVEFKFNKTSGPTLQSVIFGINDPPHLTPSPRLIAITQNIFVPAGIHQVFDPRVSFIGDLTAAHPWFKMVNVNENDSKVYKLESSSISDFTFSKVKLTVLTAPVSEAPPTPKWEPLGCYEDSHDRALPIYYYGVAYDPSKEDYKGMFEECKERAKEKGYEYFGIQHKSECWGSPNGQEITYNKHGCLNNCLRTEDGYGIGTHWSNFVYRLHKEWTDCFDGVQYKLVSKKDTCYECPSYNIKIEKSDTSRDCDFY